jgi:hypothetical protein
MRSSSSKSLSSGESGEFQFANVAADSAKNEKQNAFKGRLVYFDSDFAPKLMDNLSTLRVVRKFEESFVKYGANPFNLLCLRLYLLA